MEKNRLEAFSDGVIAIIITIMVLELKIPHQANVEALSALLPAFLSYVLSFFYVAIYWNNHHHMMLTVKRVNGLILWGNMHLLFWLSLIPFTTGWMGENHFEPLPTAFYGIVLLMAAIAWLLLQQAIIRADTAHATLARAIGRDLKGKMSAVIYLGAIFMAFAVPWLSGALYALVALLWLVPDRRMARAALGDH